MASPLIMDPWWSQTCSWPGLTPRLLQADVDLDKAVVASDKAGEAQAAANLEQMKAKEAAGRSGLETGAEARPVGSAGADDV